MENYRPLLFQEMQIRVAGIQIRHLRLNRHLPEVDEWALHAHEFGQFLVYLNGKGTQLSVGASHPVQPGSLFFLPPDQEHGFKETPGRRPLCLVLDVDWPGSRKLGFRAARLHQTDLGLVRRELSALARPQTGLGPGDRLTVAAGVLRVVDILARAAGLLEHTVKVVSPLTRAVDRLLQSPEGGTLSVEELARRAGYQVDHLNRVLRQTTGLTLGQYRAERLLRLAKKLLGQSDRVQTAAEALGFSDQNYFARWFRKHTGHQPRQYLKGGSLKITARES